MHAANRNDSGVYTCVASNEGRSFSASSVVVVTGALLTCDGEEGRERREGGIRREGALQ